MELKNSYKDKKKKFKTNKIKKMRGDHTIQEEWIEVLKNNNKISVYASLCDN